jgi:hypothetical protein
VLLGVPDVAAELGLLLLEPAGAGVRLLEDVLAELVSTSDGELVVAGVLVREGHEDDPLALDGFCERLHHPSIALDVQLQLLLLVGRQHVAGDVDREWPLVHGRSFL